MEYDDILRKIPATERKTLYASPCTAQRWKNFGRSPIETRSRCKEYSHAERGPDDQFDGDGSTPPSPTLRRSTRSGLGTPAGSTEPRESQQRKGNVQPSWKKSTILNRPYCTDRCLLGLAYGGPIDVACPNAQDHGIQRIGRLKFLRLVKAQLDNDRGADADCAPLYASRLVGSLFKVCLSSHGYTVVIPRLQHEQNIYSLFRAVQGENVPVCLGMMDVALALYCDGGTYEHLLLLSWAGRPVSDDFNQLDQARLTAGITESYTKVHELHVEMLHYVIFCTMSEAASSC
ncbi:hypothetical protein JX265_014107 [Neoarthrinium moseri]|uniref:Uncharacterized protein n=1 Tax=Neoarthrinium moseri TaxID=1658444 RepID=A0A9P9W7A0_9PEZI|nr:hypothetical protein JX265_014107 [Neoarthrinium moseri]